MVPNLAQCRAVSSEKIFRCAGWVWGISFFWKGVVGGNGVYVVGVFFVGCKLLMYFYVFIFSVFGWGSEVMHRY